GGDAGLPHLGSRPYGADQARPRLPLPRLSGRLSSAAGHAAQLESRAPGRPMIRFSNLTLARGTKVLLESADATLNPGDRIGLIGANGSGKSSLFALLRGELHSDKGEVDFPSQWRLSHVARKPPARERPAVDYAIDGDSALRTLETRLAAAEEAHDGVLMAELHTALADADAY